MKKNLLSTLAVRIFVILLLCNVYNGLQGQVILNNSKTSFDVQMNSFSGIRVQNLFSSFNTFDVQTSDGLFTELAAEKYTYTEEVGRPKLPVFRQLINIPVGAEVEVEIISSTVKEYKLSDFGITNRIMPTQPPVAKSKTGKADFVIDRKVYGQDKFYGEAPAKAEILGFLRNNHIARLDIAPVQYNPVTGVIRVYEEMTVNVKFTGGDIDATRALNEKTRSPYFQRLDAAFANELPVLGTREYLTRYPVKMVIVSDPMFQQALQPYVEWKVKKGFEVIQAYTNDPAVGTTTTSIKSYLLNLYNQATPENPAPSFVLFVGDIAQIPAFNQGSHVTDLYYCEYTNDYLPEAYYGRFSATNLSQLQPQIDKTLMYEKYLFPDPSFLGECVMIAGVDASWAPTHGNGQINYGTTHYFNQAHGLFSHTYLYPESQNASAQIISNVSNGVGYANYTAHGSSSGWASPSFSISDIPGLQNSGKYPLMVGNCCQTSMYNLTCFGEELLRAANKGAIGYIGGSNNTYWNEDFYFAVGVGQITANPTYAGTSLGNYDRIFHDHGEPFSDWYTTMDQIIFAGNLAVTAGAPSNAAYYWEIYCLMGDPSLMPYMSIPAVMTTNYLPFIPLGTTEYTVSAAPYAFVALSKDGVLIGSALADETGTAVVSFDPLNVPGTADIVITAQNKQPYFGTLTIASPTGPYIGLTSQTINDASGNNNGRIDYNETFGFTMTFTNFGSETGQNLTATISSNCGDITILNGTQPLGEIPPSGTLNIPLAFQLKAANLLIDQSMAPFTVDITNGTETWTSNFSFKLNAPVFEVLDLIVDDSQSQIPDGKLDAGETAIVKVSVRNCGHSDCSDAMTYMFTDIEGVNITDNAVTMGNMLCDSTRYALFVVNVAQNFESGTVIPFFISTNADPYYCTKTQMVATGIQKEDFETGNFNAFNWNNTLEYPWVITTNNVNAGTYSAASATVADYQKSEIAITLDIVADGNISFARKVSSEIDYDFLKFYIDNNEIAAWSGNKDWATVSYPVTKGIHTFKWSYIKDMSISSNLDKAFIDEITFPPFSTGGSNQEFTVHTFSHPKLSCYNAPVNLFAFSTNAPGNVSYQWQPASFLNNTNVYNPIANITEQTTFSATATSNNQSATDDIIIHIGAAPLTPVIHLQNEILYSDASEGNQWYNTNGAIPGAVNQSYQPTVSGNYYVVVTALNGCQSEPSNAIYVEVVAVPVLESGVALHLYPNPVKEKLNVDFKLTSASNVSLSLINLLGQRVVTYIDNSLLQAGTHNCRFETKGLRPGIYFIRYEAGNMVKLQKIILID